MEYLRELLAPKTFNRLSYVAVIVWTLCGVILLSIFAAMDNSEPRFACSAKSKNMDLVPEKCLHQYEKRHNKLGVPVYAFVIVNFCLIGIVCVIYSQLVKSRVEQLNRDAERQRPPETRKLFAAYCCQLTARFALGILFIVVQTQVLYPSNFPADFSCDLTFAESASAANASDANIQNTTKNIYECHNQQATKKTSWMNAMSVVNGLFAFVILIEIIWILSRALKRRTFMKDRHFFANHLTKANYVHPLQVELQQEAQQENTQEQNEIPQEQPVTSSLEITKRSITEITEKRTDVKAQGELPSSIIDGLIKSLKESIIEHTETLPDFKPLFQPNHGKGERMEDLKLDSIYTNLVLIPNRAHYDFSGNRQEQLKVYPKPRENLEALKGLEEILDAKNKKTLLIGRPGIGKTLFSTKFLRDWASGRTFNKTHELNFKIAFLIKFRQFNTVENLSLRDLLTWSEYSQTEHLRDELWNFICANPDKVLILFDGLDEYVENSSIATKAVHNNRKAGVEQKMPLYSLYAKVINEEFLPGAAVLTTTRATAVSSVRNLKFAKTFEILGFAAEQVEKYVENFTNEAAENLSDAGEKIKEHIGGNMNIFSLCYIPDSCFIICSSLLEVLKCSAETGKRLTGGLPVKLTQIYKLALRLFYFRHNEQYRDKPLTRKVIEAKELPPEVEKQFKSLGELAFKGIKERKLIFGSSEVPQGLENSSLFHKMPDRQSSAHEHEAQFCFIHLTMQEFLAAKHITDTMNEAELRTFVKDHINKGEWHVVLEFVAGLLGERDEQLMKIFTDLLPEKTEEKDEWQLMVMSLESEPRTFTCWPTSSEKHLALTIIKCLYEGSESNVVQSKLENIGFNAVDFSRCSLAPADCTAIVHVFKHVQQISHINLSNNNIGSLGFVEIAKLFDNDNSQLTGLNLRDNRIGDEDVKQLSKVIVNSNLELLNLSHNSITDKGLNYLSDKLVNTKVKSLDLRNNPNITREAEQRIQDANPNCKFIF
ncbi:nucleotide-binding oligomerization domain-containing protein 1-like [Oculina patagonica]